MPLHRRSAPPDDARDGNAYHSLATPRSGAGEIVMVRATKDPGASSRAHSHDREEVVLIVSGRAVAQMPLPVWMT